MGSSFKLYLIIGTIIFFDFAFNQSSVNAQTCCSGGVPLANNIGGLTKEEKGTLQISLNFDGNFLRTLKDGAKTLNDDSRVRTTYSALLNANYSFSEKISMEVLLSGIRQVRIIYHGDFEDFTKTLGIGDAVVMAYYQYHNKNNLTLSFGGGPKIPLGPSDLKNSNEITLNADLQPGSGAWDLILHHRIAKNLGFRPSASFMHLINYRITGTNNDYLGSQRYRFGNEMQMLLGVSEQNTIGSLLVDYGINLRYRHAAQDVNNEQLLPNTGGQWLFLMPSISWYLNSTTALTANGEHPVYSKVGGTQLSPTFRINVGIYLSLKPKKEFIPLKF
jgi:hypothetical protein